MTHRQAQGKFSNDQVRPLLLEENGDISAVARRLDADSEDLRSYVMNTPVLRRALDEVINRGVDKSMAVLFQGLQDEHLVNQLAAAKVFLKSRAAARRGFNHAGDLELKMPSKGGALTLTWLPPEPSASSGAKADPMMIEGKVEE